MSQASVLESLAATVPAEEAAAPPAPEAGAAFADSRAAWAGAVETEALRLRNDRNIDLNQADTRFSTALNLARVRDSSVAIVGAGAIGNAQWRAVLGMGFCTVALFDDDVVGLENIGPQGHGITDLGLPKVEAVRRAALEYRGIEIVARNRRVDTLEDIAGDLGFMPDYVITCTDSANFRNNFIAELGDRLQRLRINLRDTVPGEHWPLIERTVPALVLDYRMSLGDWNCFALPCRAIAAAVRARLSLDTVWKTYTDAAVFEPEQAVREPCTERSIVYTGLSTASYTGAILHWWVNNGQARLSTAKAVRAFFNLAEDGAAAPEESTPEENTPAAFGWLTSFSARDWLPITPTPAENGLRRNGAKLRETLRGRDRCLAALSGHILNRKCACVDPSDVRPGDYVYSGGAFSRCVHPGGIQALGNNIAVVPWGGTRRAILGKDDLELVLRPLESMPMDILFTGVPGQTCVSGTLLNEYGSLVTVSGMLRANGLDVLVGGRNVFSLNRVREVENPDNDVSDGGVRVTLDTVAVGDIVTLPLLDPETRYEVVSVSAGDICIREENTGETPGRAGPNLLTEILKVGTAA